MNETLKIGDVFPVKSSEQLKAEGIRYWEQRIATPLGIFIYDSENALRDGNSYWMTEDGRIRVTSDYMTNTIVEIMKLTNAKQD